MLLGGGIVPLVMLFGGGIVPLVVLFGGGIVPVVVFGGGGSCVKHTKAIVSKTINVLIDILIYLCNLIYFIGLIISIYIIFLLHKTKVQYNLINYI